MDELDPTLLLRTLGALKKGDFSARMPTDLTGTAGKIADTLNDIIETNQRLEEGITTASQVIGREGRLSQRVTAPMAVGGWANTINAVNHLIDDLVRPTQEMARVVGAVAKGDLSQSAALHVDGLPLQGQFLQSATTANAMVTQLASFASEVTRVAREVGTEGKLDEQAKIPGVAGTWKDLTDSVNSMADNLTGQVRNIAEVTTAVANGDLSKKITVDVRGEMLQLKGTINTMVDQLRSFASEVTRVAREVGTEGRLGGQAYVPGVAGTWKDLTDNVNSMASNLTGQVRNIAHVTTAVAKGDLSKKITVDVQGEILELKNTINGMVDQLSSFSSEVSRVAREVGTEGKLGGQAQVNGAAGTWKDLTDNVNSMASNLTGQVRNIAEVTTAVAYGDLSKKITADVRGEMLELKNTINVMVDQLNSFASEVSRVAREVGTEGRLGGQASVPGVAGTWKDLTDNVNSMASNLTGQVRNIAEVTTAVARGDLSKKIDVDVQGEILELKNTINGMVDQLRPFASEVTRVAREVGTEGKLGGQAQVEGAAGTWKDLTDSVNFMAANLTEQVRGIASVVSAVAKGDLKKKMTVAARGEIAELANTINKMTDILAVFGDQTTSVAREVGVEGKLGVQARVPGATGTWKDVTDNVNGLAATLTTQLRAIADVATAVTRGDLSRSIQFDSRGEVSYLKDNINEMIRNLRETTEKNAWQDWLKTNLARFTRILQEQRELGAMANLLLEELAGLLSVQYGVFYIKNSGGRTEVLEKVAGYANVDGNSYPTTFKLGEGLVGQCAVQQRKIWLKDLPPDYISITSALGAARPRQLVLLPIVFEQQVKAVVELAALDPFEPTQMAFLEQLMDAVAVVLNTLEAHSRTESLLTQSQSLAQELQQTNQELADKARLLSTQNFEVERKNSEVEQAKLALEDKAAQLALSSKYKSEFLANMSHELRTPLNSLLILAEQLSDNPEGNLTKMQVDFARTIHGSGSDLLTLINDILDLSKIESGVVSLEVGAYQLQNLAQFIERTFRHMAEAKRLQFSVEMADNLPQAIMTDATRLHQILKNLLSNAFKFTPRGEVTLQVGIARTGWSANHPSLSQADAVVAFSVIDTGVGIASDKFQLIFEAFQQADGSTARKYGGTGLGLSISRELARILSGEIKVKSELQEGSTFTLYLPYNRSGFVDGEWREPSRFDNPYLDPLEVALHSDDIIARPARHEPLLMFEQEPAQKAMQVAEAEPIRELHSDVEAFRVQDDDDLLPEVTEDSTFDDRAIAMPGDATVLIVCDDPQFAKNLLLLGRKMRFQGIVTLHADAALALARDYLPTAIFLDLDWPELDGFTVLGRLKRDPSTRHIPVHVLSDQSLREQSLREGAISYLAKPVSEQRLQEEFGRIEHFLGTHKRKLLIAGDDPVQRNAIVELIAGTDVEITTAETGEQALAALRQDTFQCMILGLNLPDMDGSELLTAISEDEVLREVPVVIYTAQDLGQSQPEYLEGVAQTLIIKDARSPEHLLEETALFLHRAQSSMPEPKKRMLEKSQADNQGLAGRRVLIVDDDLRNIFALSSVLERQKMEVLFAENGRHGIEVLEENPDIEIVLMDIMMPEMDGYETMRAIRRIPRFKQLPIITLTAKAMKGDRDKCIAAGASDYITKPVDVAQLLSLMRVWLHH